MFYNNLQRLRHFIRYGEWQCGWEYWPNCGRFHIGPVQYYGGLCYFGVRIFKAYVCVSW